VRLAQNEEKNDAWLVAMRCNRLGAAKKKTKNNESFLGE